MTKTQYIAGCRCPKLYWMMMNHPDKCKDTYTLHTKEGDEVGELARQFFTGSVTIPLAPASRMAAATRQMLAAGHKTICEATFVSGDESCAVDILRVHPDGIDVIEVKSTTSVKDIQVEDIAFQVYVITAAGYKVKNVYHMHLNKNYTRFESLDIHQLFVLEDISAEVLKRISDVPRKLNELRNIAAGPQPEQELTTKCDKPYPCACKDFCYAMSNITEDSVLFFPGMTADKKYRLYSEGIRTTRDIIYCPSVTQKQKAFADIIAKPEFENTVYVDKERLQEYLADVQFPLYLLDFETIMPAIPQYPGTSPYTQIPFQYSLHIMQNPNDEQPKHCEYLAHPGKDMRRVLAERLCNDIPLGANAIAYNNGFEKSVCRHLGDLYPDLKEHLYNIADNMQDLMPPFRNHWIASKAMQGSYSIKYVLPALCGQDKSIDYQALPGPHNGTEAMEAFAALKNESDEKKQKEIRDGLLAYCGLDTFAMVKLLRAIYQLVA